MSDNYFTPQVEGHPHLAPIACDPTEWIRCPQCGWPGTVEGRCAQCGYVVYDIRRRGGGAGMSRAKVWRWTRMDHPAPWAYQCPTARWTVYGCAATWRCAYDRLLQIIRAEGDA